MTTNATHSKTRFLGFAISALVCSSAVAAGSNPSTQEPTPDDLRVAVERNDKSNIDRILQSMAGAKNEIAPALVSMLKDPNQKLSELSALALVRMQQAEPIAAIAERIETTENRGLRENLLSILQMNATWNHCRAFLKLLMDGSSGELQTVTISVLGRIANDEVIDVLAAALEAKPDIALRTRLMRVFGHVTNPAAMQHLVYILGRTDAEDLKIAIPVAIGTIGNDESIIALLEWYDRFPQDKRPYVVRGLSAVSKELSLPRLLDLASRDPREGIRLGCAQALRNFPGDLTSSAIEDLLQRETAVSVRSALTLSLGAARLKQVH